MNLYVVVEGAIGEKKVYSHWIPLVNPNLKLAGSILDIGSNSVFIVGGGGYPNYFEVIENAVRDVSDSSLFDRLVIAIDSEDMSAEEKREEVADFVDAKGAAIDYRVVVQHFCLETWALGNRVVVRSNPQGVALRRYMNRFNVRVNDPELLPALPEEGLNRAHFAAKYLKIILQDRFKNLTYSKANPKALLNDKYFVNVRRRLEETNHIRSFEDFLTAFV